MSNSEIRIVDESREFRFDESFFSLTDDQSYIRYGNSVFTRISAYEEAELIGNPHNVIRHPDMPRGFFHIFWQYLKSGKTVAGYVKNLAKDGRYYWVLAVSTPCRGGYLSIRIKPSSKLFEHAKEIYAKALSFEQDIEKQEGKKVAAEKSHAFLLTELKELGYDNYDKFMKDAVKQELTSRSEILGKVELDVPSAFGADPKSIPYIELQGATAETSEIFAEIFSSLSVFHQLASELPNRRENMAELGPTLSFLALNTHISASRLGDAGATLSVISQTIRSLSKETDRLIDDLLRQIESLCDAAEDLEFNVEFASLASEICYFLAAELQGQSPEERDPNIGEWIDVVTQELVNRSHYIFDKLNDLNKLANSLSTDATSLSYKVGQMRVAQLNGRIEMASIDVTGNFLSIFEEILGVVSFALNECDQIQNLLTETNTDVNGLINMDSKLELCLRNIHSATEAVKHSSQMSETEQLNLISS